MCFCFEIFGPIECLDICVYVCVWISPNVVYLTLVLVIWSYIVRARKQTRKSRLPYHERVGCPSTSSLVTKGLGGWLVSFKTTCYLLLLYKNYWNFVVNLSQTQWRSRWFYIFTYKTLLSIFLYTCQKLPQL
jgi:hypothetical protein